MSAARVTVRVPATSANLGAGYDCFGLALGRYDQVTAGLLPGRFEIEVTGAGAGEVPTDRTHLVARAAAHAWAATGLELPGLSLQCVNCIPHGGGQGSSAAAIVAGLLAGRALLPDPGTLTGQRILELATELEGHPDNVAPALLGGFTLAYSAADGLPRAVRHDVHPAVRAVVFGSSSASSTHHARSLLPQLVPHADAAANVAAAALMVHALTHDPTLLLPATQDRLHQPYRAAAMPESAALVADLRQAGIAAMISGAGPSVLALVAAPVDWKAFQRKGFIAAELEVCTTGARVSPAR